MLQSIYLKTNQFDPIIFHNVSFSYQSGEDLLSEMSFEIKRGTRTAIVGQNGVGKSTIFQLLMRFVEPKSGKILIGNQRLSEFTIESWRDQIAWLPQNPVILNDTIRNNLKISKANATDPELIAVLEKVHLWDLVKQFENGLDTNINDLGKRLSSGEMQRLSFGRVILRNRPIVLLDEPTSFLDKESEKIIIELVETLSKSATVISIAHRLSSVLNSDQILFIHNKTVAAIGSHADLLENNPSYSLFSRAYFGTILMKTMLLKFSNEVKGLIFASIILSSITTISFIGLMALSAYLIVLAAFHPSIAALQIVIVGVRFFGISRSVFRYLERLMSHSGNLRILKNIRVNVFQQITKNFPFQFTWKNQL